MDGYDKYRSSRLGGKNIVDKGSERMVLDFGKAKTEMVYYQGSPFTEWIDRVFRKPKAYVFASDAAKNFRLYRLKDISHIQKISKDDARILTEKTGQYNNKPLYVTIGDTVASLEAKGDGFYYNNKTLYEYLDNVNVSKLLMAVRGAAEVGEFIKKNFLVLIIAGIIVFALFTDTGKEMLSTIISNNAPQVTP